MGRHSLLQGDLPDPGVKSGSSALQADSLSHQGSLEISLLKSKGKDIQRSQKGKRNDAIQDGEGIHVKVL